MRLQRGEKRYFVWQRLLAVVLMAALLPLVSLQQTLAADTTAETVSVSIQVTYGQTEARKILDEINAYQSAEDQAVYDCGLEKCAMQRAAEIALAYITTRPDDREADTVYAEALSCDKGENEYEEMILCYTETAQMAASEWISNDAVKKVLIGSDKYIGAARVNYQGTYYWVLICSDASTPTPQTGAYDGTETRSILIRSNRITERVVSNCPSGTITLYEGEYYDLSKCNASIKVAGHARDEYCALVGDVEVMIPDTSVVTFNKTSLYAQRAGSTNVSVTCGGLAASPFTVVVQQPRISGATIDAIPDQTFTGYEIRPSVKVRIGSTVLTENKDYTLQYQYNVNVGTAYVTVTGYGNYSNTGSKSTYFRIIAPSVSNATVSSISDQTYTGNPICPAVTVYVNNVLLIEGTDYTVSYSNNVNIGTAIATITGMGRYGGTRTQSFRITGPNLNAASIEAIPDQLYTGSDIRPTVTVTVNNVTLRQNTDYYVSYLNNRNEGTATVTVTGTGNYTGTKTTTFRIIGKNISNTTVNSIDTQRYTGNEIRPTVTLKIGSVTLRQNVDYTLAYRDNIQPGTASITITGAGSYSGSRTVTFKIARASLSSATVKAADQTYNGKARKPSVTVRLNGKTLSRGDDYDVAYRNNKKPGKATVVITGIGVYNGTKKGSFIIKPGKVTWISGRATTNEKGKAASLSWKKDSYATGYELYHSSKKASGYKRVGTLTKNSYTACTHNRLSSGSHYYKVRSYILVDGKKYYGAFSNAKGVKIK